MRRSNLLVAKKTTTRRRRKKGIDPLSVGLRPDELRGVPQPESIRKVAGEIEASGGAVLGAYRDPLGSRWLLLAALPIDKVAPTPYQRDLSETHVGRLVDVVGKIGRYLDPIIAVRSEGDGWWTPNGHHRLSAMSRLGAKTIVALVVPEAEVAFKILALNTEKAHNLREKSLEVIRMARALAAAGGGQESDYLLEFEDPTYITLGLLYEQRPRFAGGAYHALLKRIDQFLDQPLAAALRTRERRAAMVGELDDRVADIVKRLKARGLVSPYLKAFVVARLNPLRFRRGASAEFEETIEKMQRAAAKFEVEKVRPDQIASGGGPPDSAD